MNFAYIFFFLKEEEGWRDAYIGLHCVPLKIEKGAILVTCMQTGKYAISSILQDFFLFTFSCDVCNELTYF